MYMVADQLRGRAQGSLTPFLKWTYELEPESVFWVDWRIVYQGLNDVVLEFTGKLYVTAEIL